MIVIIIINNNNNVYICICIYIIHIILWICIQYIWYTLTDWPPKSGEVSPSSALSSPFWGGQQNVARKSSAAGSRPRNLRWPSENDSLMIELLSIISDLNGIYTNIHNYTYIYICMGGYTNWLIGDHYKPHDIGSFIDDLPAKNDCALWFSIAMWLYY